jgi:hypothetical protein
MMAQSAAHCGGGDQKDNKELAFVEWHVGEGDVSNGNKSGKKVELDGMDRIEVVESIRVLFIYKLWSGNERTQFLWIV